uniref:Uncharacterized protein n=1 Tax=Aplanochytrium stocchinoi TaxID=215587 RepID=A0A7S3PHU5_9STRA|mmetsp:Transcript_28395/g.34669  ORF Transcript_28395/g.34669 Transcript_28395/m.34669 type:complete len:212 (+) Transcript_28395:193-828(+)|eukprot:CAMPEP_0204843572 /NCGR_PEP_ID=MMETSP1346-20131115/48057_1 /ASSEMBLY_ACC=CAM_ASM_000771 /TAXON_ID=215587 /ORGANISM="Aplanochytrium stocchinoi, Strain GSBS06" /LENGTH=211 /DNA_ID=CAMNT_0051982735 /DNA_START=131 /DNA_END=766 /DNA_ORIENTATION=-
MRRETTFADGLLKSAYEVAREENIRRNHEILLSLGLVSKSKTKPINQSEETEVKRKQTLSGIKKRKKEKTVREGTRKSKRIRGETAVDQRSKNVINDTNTDSKYEQLDDEKMIRIKIERLKKVHAEKGTTYKNPTATYDHTWMRVRTMSDKALLRRVNAIEKACGQHCIVKMRMFGEVLILAGNDEIAGKAKEALNRLLKLVGEQGKKTAD